MEPPAKRLRILQSVEVDEEDAEYINAQQKQQKKFKGRLESIFAKYESMHESMSDVIDMKENKVVVDRGHLRRLERQSHRKETTILFDTLGIAAGHESEGPSEDDEDREESEDELAPTQRPKSSSGVVKPGREIQQTDARTDVGPSIAHTLATPQQLPPTPGPAANLLELVQFPQTPAGQQAQTTFYATLAQTISQAVQQAVAPLLSSILPNTLSLSLPLAHALPPTTPLTAADIVAPATDPKWFFPPLPVESSIGEFALSSPVPTLANIGASIAASKRTSSTDIHSSVVNNASIQPRQITEMDSRSVEPEAKDPATISPQPRSRRAGFKQVGAAPPRKYQFTEDDDIYISNMKILHQQPMSTIRDSRAEWKTWPLPAFYRHWAQLKGRNLHLEAVSSTLQDLDAPQDDEQHSARGLHHLPTPSSLGNEELAEDSVGSSQPRESVGLSSSAHHFDDDERELLSLADSDHEAEVTVVSSDEESHYFAAEDVILQSIETADFIGEDTLQQDLLDGSPMQEDFPIKAFSQEEVDTKPAVPTSTRKRKRRPVPPRHEAVHDSEATADDGLEDSTTSTPKTPNAPFTCTTCHKRFKTAQTLSRHHAFPPTSHTALPRKSPSPDLNHPSTPRIKRESSSPLPTAFLFSTPAPAPVVHTPSSLTAALQSSGTKAAAKLDRKAYLKLVKQSWAKRRRVGKRAWEGEGEGEGESEDELA